ncbi:dehydrogenase [Marispirochaeta aestuarii]|uniref:Dehydrogenase n=1 Tax=Marispirochaeta aestuarii TaxID=1963862 RepID=A0A1Y1RZF2_9SPIO|nr:alpha-ketoacid dehydrogenase subunit alpha/beta [Marispirochaeta aestuarii]ORC36212.1 dehydrogenase [Marispirochaeta aestuarii]
MPSEQVIKPQDVRKKGVLKTVEIPLNSYTKRLKDVKNDYSADDLTAMYHDMRLIREFENMVQAVRTVKEYNGIEYSYTGPAHLSQGQEAAAVGQAYALDLDDYTFGTHRSHGEVLARGLSAIRRLEEKALVQIMEDFRHGALLRSVEKFAPSSLNARETAELFLLYGFMTELFGREIGFTGGLGNSMHVFFTPFGIYPNNAIVGASAGIGAGAALYKRLRGENGIVIVNSGDGSISTGHAWEAMLFSTMDQLNKLWDEKYRGGLPIIFNFMNNYYAMSGQTSGETLGFDVLARIGAAFNQDALLSERVDGYNLFAVIDAFQRKKRAVLERKGPVLLDTIVYRHAGHSATDPNAYRSREEMEGWMGVDCLGSYRKELLEEGLLDSNLTDTIDGSVKEKITLVLKYATGLQESPRMNMHADPDAIAKYMFSNQKITRLSDDDPEVLGKKSENSRYKKISAKVRRGLDENGNKVSPLKVFSYRDAIFEALIDKFYEDPTMILFGEDVREHGNSFGVLQGLYESVPRHRLFNAPIAEAAIISAAVGYAMCGGRAVPEIMWCDFLGRAADELFNQLAKWQGMSAGLVRMPCVVRVSVGHAYGAQHSQDWSSLAAHIPGLKILYPATPYDAKGLLNSALGLTDPVMFFESQKLYDTGELFAPEGVPRDCYEVPIGKCDVKLKGSDLTILSIGPALYPALEAAEELAQKWQLKAEVIDARSLIPFDYQTVIESVRKTGRIIVVHDACERGGYAKTIAANISEFCFEELDAPPVSLGAHNWVSPCPELEKYFFPSKQMILDAVHERIKPLPGYSPLFDLSLAEKLRQENLGI